MPEDRYFSPIRIVFWCLMLGILAFAALVWAGVLSGPGYRRHGSGRAYCVMNQRNIQQGVRSFQYEQELEIGEPIEWDRIIGEGLWIEEAPECPVHGATAYRFTEVFPEVGTLAAPCVDAAHEPTGHEEW